MSGWKSVAGTVFSSQVYIKISEDEIADDYPEPAFYKMEDEEMDEYLLNEDDITAPEDLPRRLALVIGHWAQYSIECKRAGWLQLKRTRILYSRSAAAAH
jgi:DNA (cytosine-5)-methyltransferase 1